MADVPGAPAPQLVLTHAHFVGDIVAAFRRELSHWIPVFLAPLVEELKDLKNQSALAPLVENLKDLKDQNALENEGSDNMCATTSISFEQQPSEPKYISRIDTEKADRHRPLLFSSPGKPPDPSCSQSSPPVAVLSAPAETVQASAEVDAAETEVEITATALEECHKDASEVAVPGDQQAKTELAAPANDPQPTESVIEISAPLVGHDGQAEGLMAPPSYGHHLLPEWSKAGCEVAVAGDEQASTELAEPGAVRSLMDSGRPLLLHEATSESVVMEETTVDMSMPLVESAGPPEHLEVPRQGLFDWLWRTPCSSRSFEQKGDYHLTPRYEVLHEPLSDVEEDEDEHYELTDPAAAKRLPKEISSLEAIISSGCENLEDLDALWKSRRKPYEEDIANVRKEIVKLQEELEHARTPKFREPPPPGPAALKFVDSGVFALICNFVVVLNLTAMIVGPKFESYAAMFHAMDHVFLSWYVVELSVKALYYQRFLIFGKISVVWWNWMDLLIVLSGVVDQWLLPLLMAIKGGHLDIDTTSLRALRVLRLFRIMRFLKIIKASLKSDFAWTEGATFEWCMAGVIAFNSVVMSLEIDVPWGGWLYVENFLQVVYTFELALRLKRQHCKFFLDIDNMVWNYLDFIMVSGGALDLWLVPLAEKMQGANSSSSSLSEALKILKIMRILRVLRLVRLLKMVKPLYRLLIGVIASVKAMQWVMVLTFLMLYACSIVFTNLVGKGLMTSGGVSELAFKRFGSVPKSLFSLFKLMNGEMSVVDPITDSVTGQLLFAGFMVVSNWAILAVLTAVVSENMISTSQKANEEDVQKQNEAEHQQRIRRLTALFREIDRNGSGTLSLEEWQKMMGDRSLEHEICDATGLHKKDLNDYFECLAKDPEQEARFKRTTRSQMSGLNLDYQTFIEALKDEGVLADKRSILHLMKQLRTLESQVKMEFEDLCRAANIS